MSDNTTDKRELDILRRDNSFSDTISSIRTRVNTVNDKGGSVSSKLLSKVKTKDVDTSEKILTEAVMALQELLPKTTTGGFFSDIMAKLPFAKKIKDSVQKTIVENISAEDAMDSVFESLDKQLTLMTEDIETLVQLRDILDESNIECDAIEEEIGKEVKAIAEMMDNGDKSRSMDLVNLRQLGTELGSIRLVNQKTADNLHMQIQSSEALSAKMAEIRPLLKGMLSAQLVLAAQVEKNQRVQETVDLVGSVINGMIVEQDKQSNKTLRDTIALAQTPVIKEKTLLDLKTQNERDQIEAKKLIESLNKDRVAYQKAIADTRVSLEKNDIKLITSKISEDKK